MKECEEIYNQYDIILTIKRAPEIMKKYTIKEFAEGKKAVKIKFKNDWDKLNSVHPVGTG